MMKRILSAALVLLLALSLCACGGAKNKVAKTPIEGKWVCKNLSDNLKKFNDATLEIYGEEFTYSLNGSETSTVSTGRVETNGTDSAVLYVEKQQQLDPSGKVLQEQKVESSQSQKQAVYISLNGDSFLIVTNGKKEMQFVKE